MGYADINYEAFKPLMQFNADCSSVIVNKKARYNTTTELLDDVKAKPVGTFEFSGAAPGTGWDLARIGMLQAYGIGPRRVKLIPSKGAAPAITELLGEHVDVITCSYQEAAPQIEAGELKALAIMEDKRNPLFPHVPTLKEQGIDWSFCLWRGFGLPKDTPGEIAEALIKAMEQVFESQEFVDFMKKSGFGVKIRGSEEFGSLMAEQHKALKGIIEAAGYGKK
jgi:tripartite-type tricarboxylate transporter receptor subunit TctC